jgi:Glycosyltransferase 61
LSQRFTTCAFEGVTQGKVHIYYPRAREEALLPHYREFCERPLRPREPLAVHEVDGATFVNRAPYRCLYDSQGKRIAASRLVRYADDGNPEYWDTQPQIEIGTLRIHEEIREPVVFRTMFMKHWGHFLLESTARLWADYARPELAGLLSLYAMAFGETSIDGRFAEFLDLAGVRFLPPVEPGRRLRLAKCYIPTATFSLGTFAHSAHLQAPHRVTRRLLGEVSRDDRPVYFSRLDPELRGHSVRRIRNEADLENALAERGVRVVHMQYLSLAEQITLMNTHRVFIGAWGSALHNLLFSLRGPEISTYVLISTWLPRDFVLVDTIVGNEAHYLVVQFNAEDYEQTHEVDVDVDATLYYLRQQGVI